MKTLLVLPNLIGHFLPFCHNGYIDLKLKLLKVNDNKNGKLTLIFCVPLEYKTACEYIYHSCRT